MNCEAFIAEAIETGSKAGLGALTPLQREVFLISEAEVYCDMEGIDSFIGRYGAPLLLEAADAFSAVGASAIASGLKEIALSPLPAPEELLYQVNELICQRSGYDGDSIARYVGGHT